ncbi:hypothetical protein [Bacillus sp. Bos-x628]|uniref:hypothetical protein n=1 Tax=Bacillus maqinnsis TaxID=3229854 RepID=UPI00338F2BCB
MEKLLDTRIGGGGFSWRKKENSFDTKEFKMKAVKLYLEGNKSYHTLSEELGLRSTVRASLLKIKEAKI